MKNTFINDYRKRKRSKEVSDHSDDRIMLHSLNNSTRNGGEEKIMIDELSELIDSLDESVRKPFLMAFKGFKYEEISEEAFFFN